MEMILLFLITVVPMLGLGFWALWKKRQEEKEEEELERKAAEGTV